MTNDKVRESFRDWWRDVGGGSVIVLRSGATISKNAAQDIWQAAHAAALPDGFVAVPVEDAKNAERYKWLRSQHWSDSRIAVVCEQKKAVKLGWYCPSDLLLDKEIDAAMLAARPGVGE
ncbi:MAG: hypothetical protein ABFD94_11070 [Armatimonadia bacterium]